MKLKRIHALPANPSLPQFLAFHIAKSGLTQREIAQACGFLRPNIVSMIKKGHTRLPLERLGAMARVLEVDPHALFLVWMMTYYGETWRELAPLVHWAGASAGKPEDFTSSPKLVKGNGS